MLYILKRFDPHRNKKYKIFLESQCPLIRCTKYLDVTIVGILFNEIQ